MKRFLFSAVCAFFGLTSALASDTLTVRIENMHCAHCSFKVRKALRPLTGINDIQFNLDRRTATIAYDPAQTCADSITNRIAATGRYTPSAYSKDDVISRTLDLRIDDMHCGKCAQRIKARLEQIAGIDSLAPHTLRHYFSVSYDANRTNRDSIRAAINELGFTPVNYYDSEKAGYAYFLLPEGMATTETIEKVAALENINDVNVSAKRNSLAITYLCKNISEEQLLQEIRNLGIEATLPQPHVCKEK